MCQKGHTVRYVQKGAYKGLVHMHPLAWRYYALLMAGNLIFGQIVEDKVAESMKCVKLMMGRCVHEYL